MANFKRRKPKNKRAGCLFCKYWKVNGFGKNREDREKFSDYQRRSAANEQIRLAKTQSR